MTKNNINEANLPKLEDGCVVGSKKCYGETIMCDTCKMPLCEEHMSRKEHLLDCHYRLGQEKKTIKEMQERYTEEQKLEKEKKENELVEKVFKDTGLKMTYDEIIAKQKEDEANRKYRLEKERERIKEAKRGINSIGES